MPDDLYEGGELHAVVVQTPFIVEKGVGEVKTFLSAAIIWCLRLLSDPDPV